MTTAKYQDLGMTSAKYLWLESITCLYMRPLMCMNVSTSCEGTLPLSNLLEIHLQKGSFLCISLRVSFQSSVRGGGAFTLSLVDVVIGSAGVVSAVLHVLLQVQMAGPSGVDVTNILLEAVRVVGCPCHLSLIRGSHLPCAGTWYPLECDIVTGKFQRPSAYLVVGIFTI